MPEERDHEGTYLRYIILALLIALVVLLVIFGLQYHALRRAQIMSDRASLRTMLMGRHGPLGAGEVSIIQSWMTFDYIEHLFAVPSTTIKAGMNITDTHYPHLTLGSYAKGTGTSTAATINTIQVIIQRYDSMPTTTTSSVFTTFVPSIIKTRLATIISAIFPMGILGSLLSYLLLYKYLALGVVVYITAVIVPLPTNAMLLAVGAFAGNGYFNIWISLVVAVSTNTLGDLTDYMLTRVFGDRVIRVFRLHKFKFYEQLQTEFEPTPRSPSLRRVSPDSLSPIGSFLAGLVGVPFSTFFWWDLLGNFIEPGAALGIGYAVGNYWNEFSGPIGDFRWHRCGRRHHIRIASHPTAHFASTQRRMSSYWVSH